ncbi:hypothetical protein BGZ83_000032 [Gryganskiella cystojenkinii]|nr:hypothetical protein BGZ83_000032 [Gryganskiella cystojenkinii]
MVLLLPPNDAFKRFQSLQKDLLHLRKRSPASVLALQLPEIVECILKQLPQQSLCHSRLVCRIWAECGHRYLQRTVRWSTTDIWAIPSTGKGACKVIRLADRISTATTLVCKSDHPGVMQHNQITSVEVRWIGLMDAFQTMVCPDERSISDLFNNDAVENAEEKRQERLRERPKRPYLREIVLNLGDECPKRFRRMLPYLTQITSLDMSTTYTESLFIPEWIQLLPSLVTLKIDCHPSLRLRSLPSMPPTGRKLAKHRPLPLQTLILQHVIVTKGTLEDLLGMSPHLRVFKVIEGRLPAAESDQPDPKDFCRPRAQYFDRVYKMCPLLESFHFTIHGENMLSDELTGLIKAMSRVEVRQWPFKEVSLREWTFRSLEMFVGHNLTDLEITYRNHANGWQTEDCHRQLHEYLCNAPQLLHLRAQVIRFPMEHLYEVPGTNEGLWEWGSGLKSDRVKSKHQEPPKRWTCANLKTLHLTMTSSETFSSNERMSSTAYKIVHSLAGNWTRNTMAYISLVCPKIQDLSLGNHLDLCEEGGLCLLSRLEFLERLILYAKSASMESTAFRDLAWLSRPTKPLEPWVMIQQRKLDLEMLQVAVSTSLSQRIPQRRRRAATMRQIPASGSLDGGSNRHNLSYLQSSPMALQEQRRLNQRQLCWPKMVQFVVVLDPIMRVQSQPGCVRFARLVNRLRPEIDFRMLPSGGWDTES